MFNKISNLFCLYIKYPVVGKYYVVRNWFYLLINVKVKYVLYRNPLTRWPVNKKCFCGSKKKFKVCCRNTISYKVDQKDLLMIKTRLAKKGIKL